MTELDDPCFVGHVDDDLVVIVGASEHGLGYVGSVDVIYGKGTLRPYHIKGQVIMIEPTNYDIVAFYLLRCLYGLDYPMVMVASYTTNYAHRSPLNILFRQQNFIMVKRIMESNLNPIELTPPTVDNAELRFNTAVIIFFCRFVGCPVSYADICVSEGIPYVWRPGALGLKNARTITEVEFEQLFEISWADAQTTYFKFDDDPYGAMITDSMLLGRNIEKPSTRDSLAARIISYFRSITFDNDIIRMCLYMKVNPVRTAHKSRVRHKLSVDVHKIEQLIEKNYSLLKSPYPLRIFNPTSAS